MPVCGSCSADLPNGAKFCSHCGESVAVHNVTADLDPRLAATHHLPEETPEAPPPASSGTGSILDSIHESPIQPPPPPASGGSSLSESATSSHGRFVPGTVLDERYRIVGLLGQGGMGEVYRADDLKLGQSVALKFLPEALADDRQRLDLLHNEVRLARQVSHPNVCRVYDIGEIDGMHFLSMEFIDGEDLSGLMRRIGRLPPDKGIDIARQLCSGLYAAHEKGVLHRDLKPANIMLDGRGQVRITDFGLARLTDVEDDSGNRVGTPAYMAPEQLAGGAVTVQSDMYSLGLVLHEVFTGQPMYRAASIAELVKLREESSPSTLSSVVPDIDPAVERVILRCLEKEPTRRPGSVVQIAAALPGGDPLAAALAAGETPSPELVAASGENTGFSVKQAACWFAAYVLCLAVWLGYVDRVSFFNRSRLTKKPEVLEQTARDIIDRLVGSDPDRPVQDSAFGFSYNSDQLQQEDKVLAARGDGQMEFWYRQSPRLMLPLNPSLFGRTPQVVRLHDPPATVAGMVSVRLNPNGFLRELFYVTPQVNAVAPSGVPVEEPDWSSVFALAGLDFARFEECEPEWTPPAFSDERKAWCETPGDNAVDQKPVVVEAALLGNRVSYFQVRLPWTGRQWTVPSRMQFAGSKGQGVDFARKAALAIFEVFGLIYLPTALFLAVWNILRGRTDVRGTVRFGAAMFLVDFSMSVLEAHHVPEWSQEVRLVMQSLAMSLGRGVRFVLYYLALEPFVRQIWPSVLVSWSRLTIGKIRDAHVGRDILIGATLGMVVTILLGVRIELGGVTLGRPPGAMMFRPDALGSTRLMLGVMLMGLYRALAMVYSLMNLVVLKVVLRNEWVAIIALAALHVMTDVAWGNSSVHWVTIGISHLASLTLLARVGLLSSMAFHVAGMWAAQLPLTTNMRAWYAGDGLFALGILSALGLWATLTSLRDRPFQGNSLASLPGGAVTPAS